MDLIEGYPIRVTYPHIYAKYSNIINSKWKDKG